MRRISAVALVVTLLLLPIPFPSLAGEQTGIPPEIVANYLHAVIEADRTFYTIHGVSPPATGRGERPRRCRGCRRTATG